MGTRSIRRDRVDCRLSTVSRRNNHQPGKKLQSDLINRTHIDVSA
jgi:hypothetical protein